MKIVQSVQSVKNVAHKIKARIPYPITSHTSFSSIGSNDEMSIRHDSINKNSRTN